MGTSKHLSKSAFVVLQWGKVRQILQLVDQLNFSSGLLLIVFTARLVDCFCYIGLLTVISNFTFVKKNRRFNLIFMNKL